MKTTFIAIDSPRPAFQHALIGAFQEAGFRVCLGWPAAARLWVVDEVRAVTLHGVGVEPVVLEPSIAPGDLASAARLMAEVQRLRGDRGPEDDADFERELARDCLDELALLRDSARQLRGAAGELGDSLAQRAVRLQVLLETLLETRPVPGERFAGDLGGARLAGHD